MKDTDQSQGGGLLVDEAIEKGGKKGKPGPEVSVKYHMGYGKQERNSKV